MFEVWFIIDNIGLADISSFITVGSIFSYEVETKLIYWRDNWGRVNDFFLSVKFLTGVTLILFYLLIFNWSKLITISYINLTGAEFLLILW